jgi:hypothetical protein
MLLRLAGEPHLDASDLLAAIEAGLDDQPLDFVRGFDRELAPAGAEGRDRTQVTRGDDQLLRDVLVGQSSATNLTGEPSPDLNGIGKA